MKTLLLSVLTSILLGFASRLSGRPFDSAEFTAVLFATGLLAWTIDQYSRPLRGMNVSRPIPFPTGASNRRAPARIGRLAA